MKKEQFELYRKLLSKNINCYTIIDTITKKEDFLDIYPLLPLNAKLRIINKEKKYFYNQIKNKFNLNDDDYNTMIKIISELLDVFPWHFIRILYNCRYLSEEYFLNYYDKFPKWALQKLNSTTRIFDKCSDDVKLVLSVLDITNTSASEYYLDSLIEANKSSVIYSLNRYSEDLIFRYNNLFKISKIHNDYLSYIIDTEVSYTYNRSSDTIMPITSINIFTFKSIVKFINLFLQLTEENIEVFNNIETYLSNKNNEELYNYFERLSSLKSASLLFDTSQDVAPLESVLEKLYFKVKEYDFNEFDMTLFYKQLAYLLTYAYYVKTKVNGFKVKSINVNEYQYKLLNRLYKDANLPLRLSHIGIYESYGIFEIGLDNIIKDISSYKKFINDFVLKKYNYNMSLQTRLNPNICISFCELVYHYNYDIMKAIDNITIKEIKDQNISHYSYNNHVILFNFNDELMNTEITSNIKNKDELIYYIWLWISSQCSDKFRFPCSINYKKVENENKFIITILSNNYKTYSTYKEKDIINIKQIKTFNDINEEDFKYYKFISNTIRFNKDIYTTEIKYKTIKK